jgi:putative exosortase-associated protein (TIGR04073 family)
MAVVESAMPCHDASKSQGRHGGRSVKRFIGLFMMALLACAIARPAQAQKESDQSDDQSAVNVDQTLSDSGDAIAQPSTTKGPLYNQSTSELRARKLARGTANVVLCVAEVPNQMFREAYSTSPVTGCVVGAVKGVIKGGKRFLIGFWEIATFYNPGANHYQPLVQPEVVFGEYVH